MKHQVLRPSFERRDARGVFRELLNDGVWGSINGGEMVAGAILGDHYHQRTIVYFHLLSGAARVRTIDVATGARDDFALAAGDGVILPVMESHAIEFTEPGAFLLLKSERYDRADNDTYPLVVPPLA